jgi:hypothetical protein
MFIMYHINILCMLLDKCSVAQLIKHNDGNHIHWNVIFTESMVD